ncbi:c-type cytochrome [Agrobacterium sp. MA01]|uniref:c-type cytochrome n=1 Tax=Agrobacterium sp. MA01 TaxID=2664893 RepID=UPI00129AF474|nr:c-type cytochrome [Agrobacterium sp. MA01]
MSKLRNRLLLSLGLVLLSTPAMSEKLGLGRPALPEELAAWDVAVLPDGKGLKPGSGDVLTGEEVFGEKCAVCHGEFAEGIDSWPVLAGGDGTLTDRRPVKTIGSYWPHLSTVWDYVHRSMPFGEAQTVTVDETYAITAFLLYSNGLVDEDFTLSDKNFTEVTLPNADGFYPDDRAESEYPRFKGEPCMKDCGAPVKVTKRAIELNVTPEDPDGRPAGTLPPLDTSAASAPAPPAAPAPAEVAEAASDPAPVPAATVPAADVPAVAPAAAPIETAALDPALVGQGEAAFKKCSACHKVGEGAKNGTGPVLNGIFGAAAGHADEFKYSKALTDKAAEGLVWNEAELDAFLENPKGFMKGTKMAFAGLKKPDERAAIIAYLRSLGN